MDVEAATEAEAIASLPANDAQRVGVAEALLALPERDAELTWQQLSREVLLSEIAKYRESIRDVAGRLRVLGGDPGLPASDEALLLLHSNAGGAAAEAAAVAGGLPATAGPHDDDPDDADPLGDEGLDYTLGNVDDVDPSEWQVPPHCVPIHANVTTFDWPSLYEHCQFDVVMMDPPWQLATANPTRGVALGYSQLSDDHISGLPVPQLQRNGGFLFVWVINAKYKWTLDLFDKWGYRLVDEVVWVKMTVNRRLAKSHGYYLQHAKEVCLVAKCGNPRALAASDGGVGSDIIFSERRGQSQKPEEIYELIEQLVPNGRYLEIFARKNNLRDYWVSIGNEVTGTGLPEEDMRALKELNCIPGAVYGKTGGGGGGGGGGGSSTVGGGRSASAGGGGAAAAAAAEAASGNGGSGVAGRAASSGGGALSALAAGVSAAGARASSGAVQTGGARSAPPASGAGIPGQVLEPSNSGGGDGSGTFTAAAAAAHLSTAAAAGLPPRHPDSATAAHNVAAVAAGPSAGALRPPSRLSLGVRRHALQQHHPPGQQLPQPQPNPANPPADGDGADGNHLQAQADMEMDWPGSGGAAKMQGDGVGVGDTTKLLGQAGAVGGGDFSVGARSGASGMGDGTTPGDWEEQGQDGRRMVVGGLSPLGLNSSGGLGGCGATAAEEEEEMTRRLVDGLGGVGGDPFGDGGDMELGFPGADDWA